MISTDPDAFDASPGDLLTVVQLNALQTMAALQVLQGHISDEGAVVQLHHGEALLATGTAAQSSDAIVRDQLAVGEGLSGATADRVEDTQIDGLKLHTHADRPRQNLAQNQNCRRKCLPVLGGAGSG